MKNTFPQLIWILLIGSFLSRATYFMIWPFLSVILYKKFALTTTSIGLILSGAALAATILGFYISTLSDRFGRKGIMICSGLCAVTGFCILANASDLSTYIIAVAFSSISRALWEPQSKALIGDILKTTKDRELALHINYFLINLGAGLGPLVGIWLGLIAQQETFYLTSIVYLMLTIAIILGFTKNKVLSGRLLVNSSSFKNTLSVLKSDHKFMILILANTLILFVIGHWESSLVQYLTRAEPLQLISLITALFITNAITIVVFQFPLLRILRSVSGNNKAYLGLALLIVSQFILAFNPVNYFSGWILAIFILSLAEVIVVPNMSIQIDRMAPTHMRGSYFGAASFHSLGFSSAPVVGGLILELYSGSILFIANAIICVLVFGLYYLSKYLKRPDFIKTRGVFLSL